MKSKTKKIFFMLAVYLFYCLSLYFGAFYYYYEVTMRNSRTFINAFEKRVFPFFSDLNFEVTCYKRRGMNGMPDDHFDHSRVKVYYRDEFTRMFAGLHFAQTTIINEFNGFVFRNWYDPIFNDDFFFAKRTYMHVIAIDDLSKNFRKLKFNKHYFCYGKELDEDRIDEFVPRDLLLEDIENYLKAARIVVPKFKENYEEAKKDRWQILGTFLIFFIPLAVLFWKNNRFRKKMENS